MYDIITFKELEENELEICGIFDENFFICEGCEWAVPSDVEGTNEGYCYDEDI